MDGRGNSSWPWARAYGEGRGTRSGRRCRLVVMPPVHGRPARFGSNLMRAVRWLVRGHVRRPFTFQAFRRICPLMSPLNYFLPLTSSVNWRLAARLWAKGIVVCQPLGLHSMMDNNGEDITASACEVTTRRTTALKSL